MSAEPNEPAEPTQASSPRRVVYVVGSGRSGTSTMAGTLRTLGLHVPQPEVAADSTNPKGFGEPQWLVDTHDELLRRSGVQVSDARPRAWLDAGTVGADHAVRERVAAWLGEQLDGSDELVLKDPRAAWFLGLWRGAAQRHDATTSYVTMLRPVTEVVGSKQKYYDARQGGVTRTAAWVNMMLGTERATRGEQRAFVRYADMLADWTVPVFALGEAFDLQAVKTAMAADIAAVHRFIDPSLRRVTLTWDDVPVPASLRELADETWRVLEGLADPGGDTPEAHRTCDELRTAYTRMYDDAEAFAASSVLAARREGVRQGRDQEREEARAAVGARGERLSRVPHRVRALVPPTARRSLRKALQGKSAGREQ
ncbi:sulfotransferase family protein [Nocardioides solisilvae]|uniref:sulfotransferase family protein n=1 Tax=Nocardioides solisilvae TaxID=1542435 RepID=UPI000D743204|nr:sulfotransferase family protein [Nocardioides solisilvae]